MISAGRSPAPYYSEEAGFTAGLLSFPSKLHICAGCDVVDRVYAAVLAGHPVETWVTYEWVAAQRVFEVAYATYGQMAVIFG